MHYTNDNEKNREKNSEQNREKNNEQNSKICIQAGNNCIEDF